MSCSEFLTSFTTFYDAAPGSPERADAEAHLAGCGSCRRYVQVVDRGVSMLRQVPAPSVPANFGSRLEHRLMHVMDEQNEFRSGTGSAIPVVTVLGMAILLTAIAWTPRLFTSTPEVELPPIVVSEPPENAAPFGTARPPFLLGDVNPSPLRMGEGLFDDPTSLFYKYSPFGEKYRKSGLLRRTGLD
jgi:hypothetical protein